MKPGDFANRRNACLRSCMFVFDARAENSFWQRDKLIFVPKGGFSMLNPVVLRGVRWLALTVAAAAALYGALPGPVRTQSGLVEGMPSADGKVQVFEGIPFAAPPVGNLRWQAPQPVPAWEGVRKATAFGSRCMQARIFPDMIFRDPGPSENCLYLNVWTPANSALSLIHISEPTRP